MLITPNILIVHDIAENLVHLESVIHKMDIKLIKAHSGAEALRKMIGVELAIAIIYIHMPEMNGFELAVKLNEGRTDNKLPVIFLADDQFDENELIKGYESGACDFITMPVSDIVLNYKIKVHIDLFWKRETMMREAEQLKAAAVRQAEPKLRDSGHILQKALKVSRVGYYITDIKSGIWKSSPMLDDLFGIDDSFVRNIENWTRLIAPEYREKLTDYFYKTVQDETRFDMEYKVIRPIDGREIWVSALGEFDFDPDGNAEHLLGTIQDITQKKYLEEQLKSSNDNFLTFFDSLKDLVFVGNMQGVIVYSNNTAFEKLGFAKEELPGMFLWDLFTEVARDSIRKIFSGQFTWKSEYLTFPLVRKDGLPLYANSNIWFGKWNDEDCVFCKSRDISTESVVSLKFNKIFYNNPSLMAITNKGLFVEVNKKFLTITGFAEQEVIGKSSEDLNLFVKPEKQKMAAYELENNGYVSNFGLQIRTKSGKIVDGLFSGEIIENQGDRFILTVMSDITKLRQTEDELYLKEQQFRILFEAAGEGIIVVQDKKIKYLNPTMLQMTGFTEYELMSRPFLKFIHHDDRDFVEDNYFKSLTGENVPSRYQFRTFHRDRHFFWIEMNSVKIEWEGQPATMNFLIDVTERKRVEGNRETQFTFLTALNKIAETIISDNDAELILKNTNRIIGETLNLDRTLIYDISFEKNRITSLCEWLNHDHPDIAPTKGDYSSLDLFLNPLSEIRKTQKYLTSYSENVNKHFSKDNSSKILHTDLNIRSLIWFPFAFSQSGYYLLTLNQILWQRQWKQDEIDFLESVARQVSIALIKIELLEKRRLTEIALRESENNLAEAQQIAHIGSWELDDINHELRWSDETFRIFGYAPRTVKPTIDLFTQSIHPKDRTNISKAITQCWESHLPLSEDHRLVLPNGKERFVHEQAEIRYNTDGLPVKWVGTVQDITDKKKAEKELNKSVEQLRLLTQHIETVREQERIGISRELHDDLGQALTAVKIDLGLIRHYVSEEEAHIRLSKVSDLVSETIKTVQRLTSQLRPEIINDLGLEAAIEWYIKEFERRLGIGVKLNMDITLNISTDASLQIFRIIQESLTNIARHSKAGSTDITFIQTDKHINLTISDDGRGIPDYEIKSNKSFGILSMKERCISLGGHFSIGNGKERGTVINLMLPLKKLVKK